MIFKRKKKKNLKNQIWGFSLRAVERYQDTFDRPEAKMRIFAYQCAFFKGVCFMCRAVERWLHTFDRHVKRSKGDHLLSTGLRDGRKVDWVLSTASKEICFTESLKFCFFFRAVERSTHTFRPAFETIERWTLAFDRPEHKISVFF